jgi:hypothetical protein
VSLITLSRSTLVIINSGVLNYFVKLGKACTGFTFRLVTGKK